MVDEMSVAIYYYWKMRYFYILGYSSGIMESVILLICFIQVDRLISLLKTIGQSLGTAIDSINQSQSLPPASVQSFLKKQNISAVVITDHKEAFTNRFVI